MMTGRKDLLIGTVGITDRGGLVPAAAGGRGLALSLALICSGCAAVGPDFKTPAAPVASSYLETGSKDISSQQKEVREWWTLFRDPTLDRLIATAHEQNLTLRSAGTKVLEARALLGVAIGGYYPEIDAEASYTYNRASKADVLSNPFTPLGNFWRASLGTTIAWELDFWGKFRRGIESANAAYLSSIASYDDVLVILLGEVATTYVGIRTLQTQILIAEQNVARQRRGLAIARDRYNSGTTSRLDVYQAENLLGATEAVVPQLRLQLQHGLNALNVLLGTAPQDLDRLLGGHAPIPVAPDTVAVGIPADLLQRRPDVRAAEFRAAAQSAQIGVSKAELYPALTLTGTIGISASTAGSATISDLFTHGALFYSAGPSLQWNLFNFGRIKNDVRAQDARFQALLTDYQNIVLKAQQEVENGLATFLMSRKRAESLKRSVKAASGAFDIALLQYKEGTSDFTTVLSAEESLFQTETDLASASGDISTGLISTYKALGGGWQIREGHDFVPPKTRDEMRARTNWGKVLPATAPSKPAPSAPLPGSMIGPPGPDW